MTIWYTARGAGLAAVPLLTLATCVGTLMSGRLPAAPSARVLMQYVHRSAAMTALAVLGLHVAAIIADSYSHVGLSGALVPFSAGYRAFWVGLGTIATYAMIVVAATGFLRHRMASSVRAAAVWRRIHLASYGAWALAIVHGARAGTDTSVPWVRWLYVGCGLAVAASITARALAGPRTVIDRPARQLTVTR
jgi:methionine sulfoxide reductase heme-binding subunit